MSQIELELDGDDVHAAVSELPPLPLALALPVIAGLSAGLWVGIWQLWVAVSGY